MKRLTLEDKAFYRGYAVAIATVARDFGEPSFAAHIARANGVKLATLRASGVDSYDLDPIAKELSMKERQIGRRRGVTS